MSNSECIVRTEMAVYIIEMLFFCNLRQKLWECCALMHSAAVNLNKLSSKHTFGRVFAALMACFWITAT